VEGRYRLTLGPHGFALFALKPVEAVLHLPSPDWAEEPAPEEADLPRVHMPGGPEVLLVDTLVHERGREELLNALAQTLKEKSWLALKPQKVALLDALRFQKDPPLYLTLLQLENHRTLQVFLPLLWSPQRREGPGLFARTHGQPGHFYELSLDPGFYRLLLARLKEGFEGRSLRAYYRGRHPGPVPEAVDLLRPGLAAGEGVWVQLGLVQDGGLDRTERVLPRLDLPWVLRPEGGLFWERGASRRVLALTGSLPPGRPQDLFAALEVRLLESLPRLRGHAPGTPGLLPGALHETEALVRLLGVRLALLHRALGEVEGVEGGHPLLGRGLGAFLELEGEVYLVALGAEKRGTVEEDLARLAYDVERAVHLALEALEAELWAFAEEVADYLHAAFLQAYRSALPEEALEEAGWTRHMAEVAAEHLHREERPARKRIHERWQAKAGKA